MSSLASDFGLEVQTPPTQPIITSQENWESKHAHREAIEALQARQYWRAEWRTDARVGRAFDLGDASTLGASCRPHSHLLLELVIRTFTSSGARRTHELLLARFTRK
jgi:hypothetical protein